MSQVEVQTDQASLLPQERRTAITLALVYAFRMLGLFMVLPVFALSAEHLPGATPTLVGLAIGIYGLTQALLQIPMGVLSDRWGRKPVIIGGLCIFAIGSLVAALSSTIYGLILGRALQGAGAIAAVVMALAADASRESQRTKVMAIIGVSIGGSFLLALIIGPLFYPYIGLHGLFWLIAGLAILGLLLVIFAVPRIEQAKKTREKQWPALLTVLRNPQLLNLNVGILVLHLIMTAGFLAIPYMLRDTLGIVTEKHWLAYLGVLIASLIVLVPLVLLADREGGRRTRYLILSAIAVLALAEAGLAGFSSQKMIIWPLLVLFFAAFNLLEASLPAMVSRIAPANMRGAAMGVYSSSQFLGAFLGGILGGMLLGQFGLEGVFWFCSIIVAVWFIIAGRGDGKA